MPNQCTLVAVDNYLAGLDLGRWAGKYMCQKGGGNANLLDLIFNQINTQNRSRGFIAGLCDTCPTHEVVLSINSQSRYATAYQMASDALKVYPQINLIFAINDITAWGAINACRALNIDPQSMTVVTFGLEGDTLKNELIKSDSYCKAGLAMFPEIVSLTCIEAAIAAYNLHSLPEKYVTPHIVLTAETLSDYYFKSANGWELNQEVTIKRLKLPYRVEQDKFHTKNTLPSRIGLIVPFTEHEWYKNLTILLKNIPSNMPLTCKSLMLTKMRVMKLSFVAVILLIEQPY